MQKRKTINIVGKRRVICKSLFLSDLKTTSLKWHMWTPFFQQWRLVPHISNFQQFDYNVYTTTSGPFYKARSNLAWSSKLHFDHRFILYYIVYDYKLMIIGDYILFQI